MIDCSVDWPNARYILSLGSVSLIVAAPIFPFVIGRQRVRVATLETAPSGHTRRHQGGRSHRYEVRYASCASCVNLDLLTV